MASGHNAVVDLYALAPEEFTAARDAAAKDDKSLKALRRPTVSAWVVNTLMRREAALLDQLLALGADLGRAQSAGDATALRELGEQRRRLVGAVTQRAVELAGREVTSAVRGEVESTLEAALADPASAEAVRSGQLVRALSFAGFGGVDLEGAVAGLPTRSPARGPARGPDRELSAPRGASRPPAADRSGKGGAKAGAGAAEAKGPSKRVQQLEAAALAAQGALDDAVRHAQKVARELEAAQREESAHQQELDALAEALQHAKDAFEKAERDHTGARSRRTRAAKAADEARRKAERAATATGKAQDAADSARKALDAARRG